MSESAAGSGASQASPWASPDDVGSEPSATVPEGGPQTAPDGKPQTVPDPQATPASAPPRMPGHPTSPGLSPYPPPAATRRPAPPPPSGWSLPAAQLPPAGWKPSPPGWPPANFAGPQVPPMRATSGLFPSGPPRPVFREPFPIRGGAVALGVVGGGLWMMLFGLFASDAGGYAWLTIIAGFLAWLVALLLARAGDRGAAVGLAMSAAVGLSIAAVVIAVRWAAGDWLLW